MPRKFLDWTLLHYLFIAQFIFVHKTCGVCFCPILVQSLLTLRRDAVERVQCGTAHAEPRVVWVASGLGGPQPLLSGSRKLVDGRRGPLLCRVPMQRWFDCIRVSHEISRQVFTMSVAEEKLQAGHALMATSFIAQGSTEASDVHWST